MSAAQVRETVGRLERELEQDRGRLQKATEQREQLDRELGDADPDAETPFAGLVARWAMARDHVAAFELRVRLGRAQLERGRAVLWDADQSAARAQGWGPW